MQPRPFDDRTLPRPSAGHRPLIALVAFAIGTLALLALAWFLIATFDPQARATRAANEWRQQQLDAQLMNVDVLVAAGWRLLPLALAAGLGTVGLAALYRRFVPLAADFPQCHTTA